MSILYSNLKGGRCRRQIAKYFGVADTIMVSWLHTITYVRNICAHHSRLWNKTFGITPMMPRRTTFPFVTLPTKGTQHVYFVLCMILYLLNIINPSNTFRNKINVLLEEYPNIDIVAMGFPENWKEQPLWKSWTIKRVMLLCCCDISYLVRSSFLWIFSINFKRRILLASLLAGFCAFPIILNMSSAKWTQLN